MRKPSRTAAARATLTLVLLACAGCAPQIRVVAGAGLTQSLTNIDDGTTVRVRSGDAPWSEGRARAFRTAHPVVALASGDSVVVTCGNEVQMRDPNVRHHGTLGALAGLGIGSIVMAAGCGGQRYCGEQDPTPALAAIAGYFIGRMDRTVTYHETERSDCPVRDAGERR